MRTRIKICGITDTDTAAVVAAAGADAIGMVFHPPSERHLALAQAAAISAAALPFVSTVAVMVNPEADYVRAIIAQVKPSCLQFHGEEAPDFCAAFGLPYIKALRVTPQVDLAAMEVRYQGARGVLLDTHVAHRHGGSGQVFDWARARYPGRMARILAGGLSARNVAEAVRCAAPFAVDVSSGVERDGRKDAAEIRRFCDAVAAIRREE